MKNERGSLLLGVFLVFFIGLIVGVCLFSTQLQMTEANQRYNMGQAFYAADSGMNQAIANLITSIGFTGCTSGQQANCPSLIYNEDGVSQTVGTYMVSVLPGGLFNGVLPTVWVCSEGQNIMPGAGWNTSLISYGSLPQTRALVARLSVQNPSSYFILTLQNLGIDSGSTIGTPSDPVTILAQNVNFDVNDQEPVADRGITVNGSVQYLVAVDGNTPPVAITPPSTNPPTPATSKIPAVDFPSIDTTFYAQQTEDGVGNYVTGDYDVPPGDVFPGTSGPLNSANGAVFATGNIWINGDINVTQSVLLVATGNIYINGNITATGSAQIGLFAGGNVVIGQLASTPSDLTIESAFVLAGGNPTTGGLFETASPSTTGSASIFTGSTLTFNGAMAVRGVAGESSAIILNFANRDYSYDSDLATDYSIPLGPLAIVSVLKWEEANPSTTYPCNPNLSMPLS